MHIGIMACRRCALKQEIQLLRLPPRRVRNRLLSFLLSLRETMNPPELFLISIARVIVEVALFTLLGQGVLALFAGKARDRNIVYRLMQIITGPAVKAVRFVTPRFILDNHIPMVTFFLLFWVWIGLAVAKRHVCLTQGLICS
jgi:hypothetical protein